MAKQKDGRYRAKITVGTDANGKSIVKYVSGRTKRSLKRLRRRRVKSTSRGRMPCRREYFLTDTR